jgi:hypothetical protein
LGIDWVLQASISRGHPSDDFSFYKKGSQDFWEQLEWVIFYPACHFFDSLPQAFNINVSSTGFYLWDHQCFSAFRHFEILSTRSTTKSFQTRVS